MKPLKMKIRKVRLDRGGYVMRGEPVPHGKYFGIGKPLYLATSDNPDVEFSEVFRAKDRDSARALVRLTVAAQFRGDFEPVFYA